jgi:hypothetical protein
MRGSELRHFSLEMEFHCYKTLVGGAAHPLAKIGETGALL